ncbi:MAG: alpha/beta hydrolase [Anaerolineaceae bacterium]|nr:alpha/beta hydrolase [Anaerolineaceae bacterium]
MTPQTFSSAERNARRMLPIIRFGQAFVPLAVIRWTERRAAAQVQVPADITHEVISADGVRCEWFIPHSAGDHVLLYLHGGGFVYGLTTMHREMIVYLAQQMNARVLMVDYRLAPDHPFPAALEDCVSAYRWLLEQGFSAQHIAVAGDSAGGNLTLTTLMKLRDSGDPLPAAGACLSPATDLTERPPEGGRDPLLHPKAIRFFLDSYVAGNDAHDPLMSPVFGDWQGLPPLLIHAGDDEILRDDAVRIEQLIKATGGDVRLEIYPRMWHVWQIFLKLPEAIQSLNDIAQFLQSHLKQETKYPLPG